MTEKIRPLPDPTVDHDGTLVVHSVASSEEYDVRGGTTVASNKVIPVIFVPGIMGTNLRVRRDVERPGKYPLAAGDPAWRPPNTSIEGLLEAHSWSNRDPAVRQLILHADFLEVDDTGDVEGSSSNLKPKVMRERGWGEIHAGSYGTLMNELQSHLERTFRVNSLKQREIRSHWKEVMDCDPWKQWGVRNVARITEAELEKYATYQYPLYAFGYNWLQSCDVSAKRLEKRILEIIDWWSARKHRCDKVILITHSMGGLVARACSKAIPDKIAGVIHGAMPAVGAPLAYRRIACGTEQTRPGNGSYDDYVAEKVAEVMGRTAEETTPVMSVSPGALELLPNHFYPSPWLHVRVQRQAYSGRHTSYDCLHLPADSNPYDLYRDFKSWYRLINPALADPAGIYRRNEGGVERVIGKAIDAAEKFHRNLGDYYHERTYAFFCSDNQHLAYGHIRWLARERAASAPVAITHENVRKASFLGHSGKGGRTVEVEPGYRLQFEPEPQDAPGDDTVPHESGAAPSNKVVQLFPVRGFGHQDCFKDRNMLLLTRHLIVKIVQAL